MSETNETPAPTPGDLREAIGKELWKMACEAAGEDHKFWPWEGDESSPAARMAWMKDADRILALLPSPDHFVDANKKVPPPVSDPVREAVAALCHEQWSGWMKYLFGKCSPESSPHLGWMRIPQWAVARWTRQMNTVYKELSEEEKDSDRAEADRFLALLPSPEPQRSASGGAGREWVLRGYSYLDGCVQVGVESGPVLNLGETVRVVESPAASMGQEGAERSGQSQERGEGA